MQYNAESKQPRSHYLKFAWIQEFSINAGSFAAKVDYAKYPEQGNADRR